MTRRRYAGYISTPGPYERIGRVLFLGPVKIVVKEAFTREAWEAERLLPAREPEAENDRFVGPVFNDPNRPGPVPKSDESRPPESHQYFYGVDYV